MEEDPREAILKYADVAAKDPKFIAPAYAQTQPEPVFAKSDSEDEEKWSDYGSISFYWIVFFFSIFPFLNDS